MGGTLLGRLWPRSDEERQKAEQAGYELTKVGVCLRFRVSVASYLSGQAEQTRCELAQVGDETASSSLAACYLGRILGSPSNLPSRPAAHFSPSVRLAGTCLALLDGKVW